MLRFSLLILGLFVSFLLSLPFFFPFGWKAQDPSAEVRKIVAKLRSLDRFRVNITIERKSDAGKKLSGTLSYENGKSHLILQDGRVVATNGIYMIAYNPVNGVAAKQLVDPPAGGAGWLLEGFDYELISPREAVGGARAPKARFQKVRLQWDEKYVLRSLSTLPRGSEEWSHLYLSDFRELTSFSPSLFSYRPPTGSRTVENALNRKD